jgi:hypothetical protein
VAQPTLANLPAAPKQPETKQAFLILQSAHASASSFLEAYDKAEESDLDADVRQDLLRAMLMFASAGLDSLSKQLVRDGLPQVIKLREGARENLREFIERRLLREGRSAARFLAVALSSDEPRSELIGELVYELTGGSLQSSDELSRLAAYFDIPTSELIKDQKLLAEIFAARNQIAHELDVDFDQSDGHRRRRERDLLVDYANELLRIGGELIAAVGKRV